jgi:small subunit ribosomal protein S1
MSSKTKIADSVDTAVEPAVETQAEKPAKKSTKKAAAPKAAPKVAKKAAPVAAPEVVAEATPEVEAPVVEKVAEQAPKAPAKAAPATEQPAPASSEKKATTMAELLAGSSYEIVVPRRGATVTGRITRKTTKALYVDIDAKTEGIVADKEFEAAQEYIDELEVGQAVDVIIASSENNQGQVLLSLRKAASDARWEYFEEAFEKEEALEALGVDVNKGGLIVSVNGVRGFVPSSQFGKELVGNYMALKGKTVRVKVIEVDRDKNRLIFSERHVSEAEEIAKKEEALEAVTINEIYEGVVSGVMHFGLFVTVEVPIPGSTGTGHVEGLVHISEISWEKVTHPKEYHAVGDRLKVRVLGVDDKTGKLNLSIKQLSDDPWKDIDQRYQTGTTVDGVVSRVEPFGVFVNVEPGIDGLVHQSKLEPGQTFQRGEKITVHVESVSPDQKRMSLSVVSTDLPVAYK